MQTPKLLVGFLFCSVMLVFAACTFEVDYAKSKFTCKKDADCPTDYTCKCTDGSNTCLDVSSGALGRCQPKEGTNNEPTTDATDAGPSDEPPKTCLTNDDCSPSQTCRPGQSSADKSLCVPRCDVVKQSDCKSGEVCVLFKDRGYCTAALGKKRSGQLCDRDGDCEIHLYCRPVKGFTTIKRCTGNCDMQKPSCPKTTQACLELRQENKPYGFCEPVPTEVAEGEICTPSGDFQCVAGLKCVCANDGRFRCQR